MCLVISYLVGPFTVNSVGLEDIYNTLLISLALA